jgi:hypothetical protein
MPASPKPLGGDMPQHSPLVLVGSTQESSHLWDDPVGAPRHPTH